MCHFCEKAAEDGLDDTEPLTTDDVAMIDQLVLAPYVMLAFRGGRLEIVSGHGVGPVDSMQLMLMAMQHIVSHSTDMTDLMSLPETPS